MFVELFNVPKRDLGVKWFTVTQYKTVVYRTQGMCGFFLPCYCHHENRITRNTLVVYHTRAKMVFANRA